MQLSVDATLVSHAFIGAGYIQQIASDDITSFAWNNAAVAPMPINLAPRILYNQNLM